VSCDGPLTAPARSPWTSRGKSISVSPALPIGDSVRGQAGSAQPTVHKFTAPVVANTQITVCPKRNSEADSGGPACRRSDPGSGSHMERPDSVPDSIILRDGYYQNYGRLPARDPI
jgi:hypothetical protein